MTYLSGVFGSGFFRGMSGFFWVPDDADQCCNINGGDLKKSKIGAGGVETQF